MAGMLWVLATATIVQFLLGGVWYGPLFGGVWQRAMNTKLEYVPIDHKLLTHTTQALLTIPLCRWLPFTLLFDFILAGPLIVPTRMAWWP